jgi:hypothetical protein
MAKGFIFIGIDSGKVNCQGGWFFVVCCTKRQGCMLPLRVGDAVLDKKGFNTGYRGHAVGDAVQKRGRSLEVNIYRSEEKSMIKKRFSLGPTS